MLHQRRRYELLLHGVASKYLIEVFRMATAMMIICAFMTFITLWSGHYILTALYLIVTILWTNQIIKENKDKEE